MTLLEPNCCSGSTLKSGFNVDEQWLKRSLVVFVPFAPSINSKCGWLDPKRCARPCVLWMPATARCCSGPANPSPSPHSHAPLVYRSAHQHMQICDAFWRGRLKLKGAARADRDYFTSVITGLSLALMRMTSVFDSLSVAFRPKCLVFGGVYTSSPALTILVPTPSISKVCSPAMT